MGSTNLVKLYENKICAHIFLGRVVYSFSQVFKDSKTYLFFGLKENEQNIRGKSICVDCGISNLQE